MTPVTAAELPEVSAEWDALFAAGPSFQSSRAWFEATVEAALPPGSRAELLLCRDNGRPAAILPLLHGPFGEDGTLQGLLELADLRYVGSGVTASAVMMDKHMMKIVFEAAGLPVGPYVVITDKQWRRDKDAAMANVAPLRYPVFVKPARAGSSVGISKVDSRDQLEAAIAALHDDARSAGETDWTQILSWYDELVALSDDPVHDDPAAVLGRAVAVGHVHGAAAGLRETNRLREVIGERHRWHAARGHLHELGGDLPAAATAYAEAARRATNVAERDHLVRQAARARAGELLR